MIIKKGKAGINVLDRSVVKRLGNIYAPEDNGICFAGDPVTVRTAHAGKLAVTAALNNIYSMAAVPSRLISTVLLPEGEEEETLRRIEDEIEKTAGMEGVKVSGGHTEVTSAVTRPVVNVSVVGEKAAVRKIHPESGMKIVASKWTALEGSYIIAGEKQEELYTRFPVQMIETAAAMGELLSVRTESQVIADKKIAFAAMVNCSEGGIYAALWKLSQKTGMGFTAGLDRIPIRQETIEIADFYNLNPYVLEAAGCMLCVTNETERLIDEWNSAGIHAAVIGELCSGNDKIIVNGEDRQNLNRPEADSILKILG